MIGMDELAAAAAVLVPVQPSVACRFPAFATTLRQATSFYLQKAGALSVRSHFWGLACLFSRCYFFPCAGIMPANRSLLGELLAADFERCLDGAIGRVRERVPSREHLKQHGLIKKDWTYHMNGFEWIRAKARNCMPEEYAHYKMMVNKHELLTATKFGLVL